MDNGRRRVTYKGGRWCNVYSKTGERRSKGRPSASGQQGRLKKKMDSLRGRSIVHPSDGERRRECLAVLRGSALASRTGGDIVTPFASTASLSPNGDRRWQVPQLTLCDGQQTRGQKRATPAAFHVTWLVPTSDRGHALCVDSRSGLGGSGSSVARVVVDSGPRMASQNAGDRGVSHSACIQQRGLNRSTTDACRLSVGRFRQRSARCRG